MSVREDFSDAKVGDILVVVTTTSRGKPLSVTGFNVLSVVRGKWLQGIPCYANGNAMIYFGSTYRARGGRRIVDSRNAKGWHSRLARSCPEGFALPVQAVSA